VVLGEDPSVTIQLLGSNMYRLLVVITLTLVAQVCYGKLRVNSANVIRTVLMTDGQRVQHIIHNGILARDTVIPNHPEELSYREVTDGKELVQAIMQGRDKVLDCDIRKNDQAVTMFTETFVPDQFRNPKQIKEENITTLRSGESLPESIRHLADFHSLLKKCREHHKYVKLSLRRSKQSKEGYSGTLRKKRAAIHRAVNEGDEADFGILPGTNWCGRGSKTSRYEELGTNRDTDKCCRTHDHCPFYIGAMQTKYGYLNFRLHTLSHCDCDHQ
jgi:secretory phospholipase A2